MKLTRLIILCSFLGALALSPSSILGQIEYPPGMVEDGGVKPLPFSRVGVSGWQFLKLPTNARQAAMGGVLTATSYGDASSSLANPASMADVEGMELSVSQMGYFADTDYQNISLVKNMGVLGIIGVNLIYMNYGDQVRTENVLLEGGIMDIQTEGLGTFSANDLGVGLAYARQITDKLQVGGNVRVIRQSLDDASMTGLTFDVGTVYYTGIKSLRIAMLGRHFGADTEYESFNARVGFSPYPTRTPSVFLFGAAYDIIDDDVNLWTVASEFTRPNDGDPKVNFGTEYTFNNLIILRAGYRHNYDEEDLTLGGGINVKTSAFSLRFDYAFIKFGRLGDVNMISMAIGL